MQSCFLCFDICVRKTHKKETSRSRRSYGRYTKLTMTTSSYIVSYKDPLPTKRKSKGRGNKIVVGTVVKAKIGELEEEVRAGSSIRMGKYFTGVSQVFSWKKRFLVRFQDGCENNMSSNQLTMVIVEKTPEEKEPEVSEIYDIPEEQAELEKGYCFYVYVMLRFKK